MSSVWNPPCLCLLQLTQTELVLKTYLRLAEDVVMFQTIPAQRRRSLMQGLTANMGDLFQLFITLLQQHTAQTQVLVVVMVPCGANVESTSM